MRAWAAAPPAFFQRLVELRASQQQRRSRARKQSRQYRRRHCETERGQAHPAAEIERKILPGQQRQQRIAQPRDQNEAARRARRGQQQRLGE